MGKPKKRPCLYCGKKATTRDHIPPKCFFPQPRPSNLITVPSCIACNNLSSKDEENFRAVLMFSDAGESEAGKALWDQKLHRSFKKNIGLRKTIARSLSQVEITTAQGIFVEQRVTIQYDQKRILAVIDKIVRGLYYFEYKDPLPASHALDALFLRSEKNYNAANQYLGVVKDGSRSWLDVFQYKHNRVEQGRAGSMWLLRFWGCAAFWIIAQDEKHTPD